MSIPTTLWRERPTEPVPYRFTTEEFGQMEGWGFFTGKHVELIDGSVVERATGESHRFTHDELFQMVDESWFGDCRVQLIEGELIEMPAQKNTHAISITLAQKALEAAFGPQFWVRVQFTLNLSPWGVLDPDLAVVPIGYRSAAMPNPTSALLVVEVSDTTLRLDRRKANVYAAGGIGDYWIINLVDRKVEVRRDPRPDTNVRTGASYATLTTLQPGDTITPLAAPNATIAVADTLP
jgi:Uma2 family endonuclease